MFFVIIGVVGSIASGKGVVSDILKKKGFIPLMFSDILRKELSEKGIEITRKNLQDYANELRKNFGADYLARRLIAKTSSSGNYVLEGIRNPAEIYALRESGKTFILGIDAPLERRFQWIIMRGKENDPHTLDEVKTTDDRDNGVGEPEWGLQVKKSMALADVVVINDKTKEHLEKKIDKIISKLKL